MVTLFPGFELPQDQPTIQATETEGGEALARYLIRALRQLRVGDQLRQPGELVPEAAEWPNLRHYEGLAWVERVPVPNDYSGEGAIEYPPQAPSSRLAEVLAPEGKPQEPVVAWSRKTGASLPIRCLNCRKRNWLPADLIETSGWICHSCGQGQTTVQAREHPAPTSLGEWVESFDAAAVDDDGALKYTPGAGAAAASAAGVKTGATVKTGSPVRWCGSTPPRSPWPTAHC
jgi:hypothetical protein